MYSNNKGIAKKKTCKSIFGNHDYQAKLKRARKLKAAAELQHVNNFGESSDDNFSSTKSDSSKDSGFVQQTTTKERTTFFLNSATANEFKRQPTSFSNSSIDTMSGDDSNSLSLFEIAPSHASSGPSLKVKPSESLESLSSGTLQELDSLSLTVEDPTSLPKMSCPTEVDTDEISEPILVSPLFPSRFPNIPPTIYFAKGKEKVRPLPVSVRRHLKWKLSSITPVIVRQTVLRSGYRIVRELPEEEGEENPDWSGIWGKHMKSTAFRTILDHQKVNHFPGSFHFGRKDKLWQNVSKMVQHHGRSFNFIPETYILPQDAKNLRNAWERSNTRRNWIIKPPASARGTGVHVIHKWSQIPKKQPVVVQRYLSTPYLINDTKFDLRLYVLLTSFDPLRIYVFDDGLVRFASVKYSKAQQSLSDRFMHLTNYSINKRSASYTSNEDETLCQGHKWSLKALWGYFEEKGVDTQALWSSLTDIIIKTIISCENNVWKLIKANTRSRYTCYELFGFDILLDKNLRPWLLEVNISPSLHSSSLLDTNIKGHLVKDMLNIAGYQVPNRVGNFSLQSSLLRRFGINGNQTRNLSMNKSLHRWKKSPDEKDKHKKFENDEITDYTSILDDLTPDDVRILIEGEDEFARKGNFIRVFPTEHTHLYHQFFEFNHYYNYLQDMWERKYHSDRSIGIMILQDFAKAGYHLKTYSPDSASKGDKEKGPEDIKSKKGPEMAGGDKQRMSDIRSQQQSTLSFMEERKLSSTSSGSADTRKVPSYILASKTSQSTLTKPKSMSLNNKLDRVASKMTAQSLSSISSKNLFETSKYQPKRDKKPIYPALVIWNGGWITLQPPVPTIP